MRRPSRSAAGQRTTAGMSFIIGRSSLRLQSVELVGGRNQRKRQLPRGSAIKLLAIEHPAINVNPAPTDAAVSVLESIDLHGHSFAALGAVEEPVQDVGVEDVPPLVTLVASGGGATSA